MTFFLLTLLFLFGVPNKRYITYNGLGHTRTVLVTTTAQNFAQEMRCNNCYNLVRVFPFKLL